MGKMKKSIIIFIKLSIAISFTTGFLFCNERKIYESPGPGLKEQLKISVHDVGECKNGNYYKPITYNERIHKTICKKPIFTNSDFKTIKIIKTPHVEKSYSIFMVFKESEALKQFTSKYPKIAFFVNNKLSGVVHCAVTITNGLLTIDFYSKEEITKLIGKETFKKYDRIWEENAAKE